MAKKYSIENEIVYLDSGWPLKWEKPKKDLVQIPQLAKLSIFMSLLQEKPQEVSLDSTYQLADERKLGEIEFPPDFTQEDVWAVGRYLAACLFPSNRFIKFAKQLHEQIGTQKA